MVVRGKLVRLSIGDDPEPSVESNLDKVAALPYVESVLALPDVHQKAKMEVPSSIAIPEPSATVASRMRPRTELSARSPCPGSSSVTRFSALAGTLDHCTNWLRRLGSCTHGDESHAGPRHGNTVVRLMIPVDPWDRRVRSGPRDGVRPAPRSADPVVFGRCRPPPDLDGGPARVLPRRPRGWSEFLEPGVSVF